MRRLNTGIIGLMVLVRGDWWHWCDNWQKPLVRKVMHCELVHSALCPGVRSLCALIAWQGAQIQCSTLMNNSGAVPWCRGLVPPTKCQGLSPILATHPPPSSTPHQPYLPTTKDPEHPIDDSLSWTDVAILTTDLIHLRAISTPSLSRNNNIHIFSPIIYSALAPHYETFSPYLVPIIDTSVSRSGFWHQNVRSSGLIKSKCLKIVSGFEKDSQSHASITFQVHPSLPIQDSLSWDSHGNIEPS